MFGIEYPDSLSDGVGMTNDTSHTLEHIRAQRDTKAIPHLQQYAPVWLVDEHPDVTNQAVQFNVIFYHPSYGWVNRRYRYDAFNDVLYHKGQNLEKEERILDLEDQPPYISAESINTLNSYGG